MSPRPCVWRTLPSASLPVSDFRSSIAAWIGWPISGRTVGPLLAPGSCASALAATNAIEQRPIRQRCMRRKRMKQRRTGMGLAVRASAHELLVADQADFLHPQPLRRSHHHRHALVLDQLVGAQMYLRLIGHLGGRAQPRLELLAIRQYPPVPDQG